VGFLIYNSAALLDPKTDLVLQYNRLAQREFRRFCTTNCSSNKANYLLGRRRKEHLKNLEQAQKEQSSEKSEEIERLRYQNDELRRENEALRAQLYGSSSSSTPGFFSAPIVPSSSGDARQYSLSPSISGASLSGTGSPSASMSSDMMPMAALSITSSMLPPSMQAYTDPALSSQPYSMVPSSGLRHNSQSSPELSGFGSSQSAMGPSFQSLNVAQSSEAEAPHLQRRASGQPSCVEPLPKL